MILATACSDDDDCATCPAGQRTIVFGDVDVYDGELEYWSVMWNTQAMVPDVDSVLVNGIKCQMQVNYFGEGGMALYAGLDEGGGMRVAAAELAMDSVEIEFFAPYGSALCVISALDEDVDTAALIEPLPVTPWDTVAIDDPIELTWSSADAAEWYMLYYYYYYDSAGTTVYGNSIYLPVGTDTTYTLPGSLTGYNGRYRFRVYSMTGPRPDQSGNVAGSAFGGVISSSVSGNAIYVYVGNGMYNPPVSGTAAYEQENASKRDIMMDFYR